MLSLLSIEQKLLREVDSEYIIRDFALMLFDVLILRL